MFWMDLKKKYNEATKIKVNRFHAFKKLQKMFGKMSTVFVHLLTVWATVTVPLKIPIK